LFSFKQESVSSAATIASLDAWLASAFSNSTNKGTPPAATTAALFLHGFPSKEGGEGISFNHCMILTDGRLESHCLIWLAGQILDRRKK
jgi:hypothetical protein